MKTIFCPLFLIALAIVPLCPSRAALNPAIVADDSRWVIAVDLDGLRGSVLGKELIAQLQKEQSEFTKGAFGIDFQKVLGLVRTATAYGANLTSDPKKIDGVLVVEGTPGLRKIAEGLLLQAMIDKAAVVSEVKDLPFPAYAISGDDKGGQVVIGFPPEPVVLVSKSVPQLLKAREVFRGASPSLARAVSSPLHGLIGNSQDAYLFAAVGGESDGGFAHVSPEAARFLRLADAGSLAIGESGEKTFGHVELHGRSDDGADKISKILQGMTAMMSLAESSDQQLTEFLNSAAVTRNDDTVSLDLSYSSLRLVQMIQNFRQEHRPGVRMETASGPVVAEWGMDQKGEDAGGEVAIAWRTVENIHLVNGALVTLAGHGNRGRGVQFSRIEITPAQGSAQPLVFQARYMKLTGFRPVQRQSFPGENLVIGTWPVSNAQLEFPGEDGTYTLRVAYLNQPGGKGSFSLHVKNPEPPPAPAHDDSLERSAH